MIAPDFLKELGFGVRQLSFEDFQTASNICGIKYFFTDEKVEEGISFTITNHNKRERIIVLRRILFPDALAEVAWHEFSHSYYEHYGVRLFLVGSEDKYERFADDFSLCCRIPTAWMESRTRNEILDEGFTNEQIDRRVEIYESTGT